MRNIKLLKSTIAVVGLAAVAVTALPNLAFGQSGMSFSVYTDASVNEDGLLSMWATVVDNSWGCNHGNYTTSARIISPSHGDVTVPFAGLQASASMWIGDDFGDYTTLATGTYSCSCFPSGSPGYGGGQTIRVRPFTARLLYNAGGSSPEPHGPNSKDFYVVHNCSGFCQPAFVEYDHSVGIGHGWLEIKGFDTSYPSGFRDCKARARGTLNQPDCRES